MLAVVIKSEKDDKSQKDDKNRKRNEKILKDMKELNRRTNRKKENINILR
jgi:hypothetical protein